MDRSIPRGEFGLIDWIRSQQQTSPGKGTVVGIGDDCAVLEFTPGSKILVTTDMLMDGRHFRLADDGALAAGYKAMGVNLSDIAAMAGVPRAAVVSVALPKENPVETAQELHAGLKKMADRFEVDLVGGDTNAWDGPLVVNVTLMGEATVRGAVMRSGAKPGDAILLTGQLGGSFFRGRHLRPEPRVREALALAQAAQIHAMIDLSDGLSSDLRHILTESGNLGALIEAAQVPLHSDAIEQSQSDGIAPIDHALHDGEDFELCVVCSADDALRLLGNRPGGTILHRIGQITSEPGLRIRDSEGTISHVQVRGFDHLRVPGLTGI
jgi:thiamine-monophosphate kinase